MSDTKEIRCVSDVGTLETDDEFGEGSIRLRKAFLVQDQLWQLDILSDWIRQLQQLKDELHDDVYGD